MPLSPASVAAPYGQGDDHVCVHRAAHPSAQALSPRAPTRAGPHLDRRSEEPRSPGSVWDDARTHRKSNRWRAKQTRPLIEARDCVDPAWSETALGHRHPARPSAPGGLRLGPPDALPLRPRLRWRIQGHMGAALKPRRHAQCVAGHVLRWRSGAWMSRIWLNVNHPIQCSVSRCRTAD
jgi:hypothetical protein